MKPTRHQRWIALMLWAPALALAETSVAVAQIPPKPTSTALQSMLACRAEPDERKRLACYDGAAAQLQTATSTGDLVVVDRNQVRALRRQAFGFTLPSLAFFTGPARRDDGADSIELVFTGAQPGVDGHTLYSFDDGSVWRQLDQSEFGRRPKAGEKAEIKRASLGGFFMSIGNRPGVKVQRQH